MRLVLLVLLALLLAARPGSAAPPPETVGPGAWPAPGARVAGADEQRARSVLARWDTRRAAAWSDGEPAGRRDRRMLEAWTDRGLRVRHLAMHVLRLDVLEERPGLLRLRVTDRLGGAVAVGGGVRRELPGDRPTTRELVLRRGGGAWRVVSVRLRGW